MFESPSVANLRLTTIKIKSNKPKVIGAFLGVGRRSDKHIKSETAIKVPIISLSGRLHRFGYTTSMKKIDCHPDSKILFNSKIIPSYERCEELAIKLHQNVPFVECIGWDLSVNKDGDVIPIEWNG